jgi:hypothetical protein
VKLAGFGFFSAAVNAIGGSQVRGTAYAICLIVVLPTVHYSLATTLPHQGFRALFDNNQIRELCTLLLHETNNTKIHELAKALRAMIASNVEETRSRLEFTAKHYPEISAEFDENTP